MSRLDDQSEHKCQSEDCQFLCRLYAALKPLLPWMVEKKFFCSTTADGAEDWDDDYEEFQVSLLYLIINKPIGETKLYLSTTGKWFWAKRSDEYLRYAVVITSEPDEIVKMVGQKALLEYCLLKVLTFSGVHRHLTQDEIYHNYNPAILALWNLQSEMFEQPSIPV